MPNYYYFNTSGQKYGPVSDQQLQTLAAQGVITPNTPLETEGGHKGTAGQIPGLKFNTIAPPSFAQPPQKTSYSQEANNGDTGTAEKVSKSVAYKIEQALSSSMARKVRQTFSSYAVIVVGIIAICIGVIDFGVSLGESPWWSTREMQRNSGHTFGSPSNRNDVETYKSRYMQGYAIFSSALLSTQLGQRRALNVIVICFGTFLVAYGSRREKRIFREGNEEG